MENVKRVYVEKKSGFNIEAKVLLKDLKENLKIKSLENVRVLVRYDISGLNSDEFNLAVRTVLSEPPVDKIIYDNSFLNSKLSLSIEYLPGQYDQRGDSAAQCIQTLTLKEKPTVRTAKVFIFTGDINEAELSKIKNYLINPVDSREASNKIPGELTGKTEKLKNIEKITGFISMSNEDLEEFKKLNGISISSEDLAFCRDYFRNIEKRDPTETEIKILDTYWSDHCRHTTFETVIENVDIEKSELNIPVLKAYRSFSNDFVDLYGYGEKNLTLMSIATMSMKLMREKGELMDLEISDEINACSIEREVVVDGHSEKWLIMFKNETHNHPTEIEPFGGAATCLGGAIRDPLSGRAYVYQSMRITGSGDPRKGIEETISGKLPQRKITKEAARGFSSYGNQIGLATGIVNEIYHEGYVAKRMEVGAVIGAVPKRYVVRESPSPGDVVILVGGKTGRDGIGGATGSSKEHDERSVETAGAEVQKGNAPEERKLQRLFRKPEVIKIIKRSNDFGAGGVSVAVGELADGVRINLDVIPKKYEGLNGTELALSESQERMAVVVARENVDKFIECSESENLEATIIAEVTSTRRLEMFWRGDKIVDISRDFLDTSGVKQKSSVFIKSPDKNKNFFNKPYKNIDTAEKGIRKQWFDNISSLNNCSKRGLTEMFDGTIGAGTVLMPFGGKYGKTPIESMAALIPVINGQTETATLMSFGFNPEISSWSPFHGGIYSIVETVSKIVASGGDYSTVRLSLQEYFEKLGKNSEKWGKPFASLIGAYFAIRNFGIAAIGGKDSMSGTFLEKNVPPTLIAFGVDSLSADKIISPEFKETGNKVIVIRAKRDKYEIPDFPGLIQSYKKINKGIKEKKILSAHSVGEGGIALALTKMSVGNRIGIKTNRLPDNFKFFTPDYGSFILEIAKGTDTEDLFKGVEINIIGETIKEEKIEINNIEIQIDELLEKWESTLSDIFPVTYERKKEHSKLNYFKNKNRSSSTFSTVKPRVMIPVFPGTNCEFDMASAFNKEGAVTSSPVFQNLTSHQIEESIDFFKKEIEQSQIIAIPGGFSAGDEPDGSGKFIASVFRNPALRDAIMNLLYKRDGLIIGICNGFQALIKLGLIPYGEIRELNEDSPTLTFNLIGHHISRIVRTKIISTLSPWLYETEVGEIHSVPISHGEGRFTADPEIIKELELKGQIATQYVDFLGNAIMDSEFNPNGSDYSIEGITSPDGKVFGKMGHSERVGDRLYKNVHGKWNSGIFKAGINYFK